MTQEREKICRQVAALFALTTSSVAGEAQAAKDKVRELVKSHALTFADVSPHGNQIGLAVMRSFWSISGGGSWDTAGPTSGPAPPPAAGPRSATDALRDVIDQMRRQIDQMRRQGVSPAPDFSPYGRPYFGGPQASGWGPGRVVYGWDNVQNDEEPPASVLWQGVVVAVSDLTDYALATLIGDHQSDRDQADTLREKAHDAIDDGRHGEAIRLVATLQLRPPKLTDRVFQALLEEWGRRCRRDR